jgi:hypothetical protein
MSQITYERARELLNYEPDTGRLLWRLQITWRRPIGSEAGSIAPNGHRYVGIDKRDYQASRLIWLLMTGAWPDAEIDHKNRDPLDNRWENLRAATSAQNKINRHVASKFGLPRGVHRNKKRFIARICIAYKSVCLGTYDTPEEAHAAYLKAARERHGDFLPT